MNKNRLSLIISSFVITFSVVIYAFVTATTYTQLIIAILLYPFLVYLAYKVISHRSNAPAKRSSSKKSSTEIVAKESENGVSDGERRAFLKLIGGAGIFLFLFSLFNKRPDPMFLKDLPMFQKSELGASANNGLSPPTQPLDAYRISDIDDSTISYYGFTKTGNEWVIMRVDTSKGTFRYVKGIANYSENWAKRGTLTYDYYNNIF